MAFVELSLDDDSDSRTLITLGARLTVSDGRDELLQNCRSKEKRIRISFAGPIAEGRFAGRRLNLTAAHNDVQRGVLLRRELADSQTEREIINNYLHTQAENLVRQHWKKLNQLATKPITQSEFFRSKSMRHRSSVNRN